MLITDLFHMEFSDCFLTGPSSLAQESIIYGGLALSHQFSVKKMHNSKVEYFSW